MWKGRRTKNLEGEASAPGLREAAQASISPGHMLCGFRQAYSLSGCQFLICINKYPSPSNRRRIN